jgi:MerR family transcriptional regulator, thiopeptide resistance regulator
VLRGYTVKQVAKLSGVSVRTLHHYDEIGLLKPESVGANGYRYYGQDELLRLQQILFHRELGFPLAEIARVLDAPDFDRVAALKAHRERLEAETKRYRRLVATIDETLAALQGATTMDDKAMYRGFDPKKQAEREAELVERFGEGVRPAIEHARKVVAGTTQTDFEARQAEFAAIEDALASALSTGAPGDSAQVQALIRRLHTWVGGWWGEAPSKRRFVGLGQFYVEHPEFRARYEAKAAGLSEYLAVAMQVFAERELA